jgi:hypothetical protein
MKHGKKGEMPGVLTTIFEFLTLTGVKIFLNNGSEIYVSLIQGCRIPWSLPGLTEENYEKPE